MRLLCCLPNNCLIEELSPGGQGDNLQCWRTQRGRQQLLTLENATRWPPSGIRASSIDHTHLSSLDADLDEIGFKYQVTTWPFQKSWKPGEPESSISSIWQTTQWSRDAMPKPRPDSGRKSSASSSRNEDLHAFSHAPAVQMPAAGSSEFLGSLTTGENQVFWQPLQGRRSCKELDFWLYCLPGQVVWQGCGNMPDSLQLKLPFRKTTEMETNCEVLSHTLRNGIAWKTQAFYIAI